MIAALVLAAAVGAYYDCAHVVNWEPAGSDRPSENECVLFWDAEVVNTCAQPIEVSVIVVILDAEGRVLLVDDNNIVSMYPNERAELGGATKSDCVVPKEADRAEVYARASGLPS